MASEKPEVLAVHKHRLETFLRELEFWEPMQKGELKCIVCGTTITVDNIGFIIPSAQDIVFCCSNPECIYEFNERRAGEPKNDT